MKTCEICQAPIQCGSARRLVCSDACKEEKKRRYDLARRQQQKVTKPRVTQPIVTEKRCKGCRVLLAASAFHRNRWNEDGLQDYCKECRAEQAQRPAQRQKDARRKKRWYRVHREEQAIRSRQHYLANKEAHAEDSRRRYLANRERALEQSRLNYQQRKQKVLRTCHCGNTFLVFPNDHSRYFCSRACAHRIKLGVCEWLMDIAQRMGIELVRRAA